MEQENNLPKGVGIISKEQILENLLKEDNLLKRKYCAFSIDNVNSDEEYKKMIEDYFDWLWKKRDYGRVLINNYL